MKKKILAFLVAAAVCLSIPFTAFAAADAGAGYTDLSGWYSDAAVKYGYPGIFSDGSGKFYPDHKVTRIEFVCLLHTALGISINYFVAPDVSKDFKDMKNSDAGASELIDLVTAGIVDKGGSFEPGGSLDRELMIHWILNALNYKTGGSYPIPMVKPVPFSDDALISDAYRSEIYSAVVLQLVHGRGNNTAAPKDGALRSEAVTIVARLMDLLNKYASTEVKVAASAEADKNGALVMRLTIQNNTGKTVTITHSNGQHYDFLLLDAAGKTLYQWSKDKMFNMLVGNTALKPGQTVVFSETLDADAFTAIKPSVASMKAFLVGTSDDFTISPDGYPGSIAA